jgi:hypothetical protein
MDRAYSTKRKAYTILVGKPQGKATRRWESNIKMDLVEITSRLIWLRAGTTRGFL